MENFSCQTDSESSILPLDGEDKVEIEPIPVLTEKISKIPLEYCRQIVDRYQEETDYYKNMADSDNKAVRNTSSNSTQEMDKGTAVRNTSSNSTQEMVTNPDSGIGCLEATGATPKMTASVNCNVTKCIQDGKNCSRKQCLEFDPNLRKKLNIYYNNLSQKEKNEFRDQYIDTRGIKGKRKNVSHQYYLSKNGIKIPVCKPMWMTTLGTYDHKVFGRKTKK